MTVTTHTADWASALAKDVRSAKDTITITTMSMLPPRRLVISAFCDLWAAMIEAAQRHVAINAIMPEPHLSHPATLRNDSAARAIAELGGTTILLPTKNLLHAKTCLIDKSIAWIGSGNWTQAAAAHNFEIYLRCEDPIAAMDLAGFHQKLALLNGRII